MNRCDDFLQQYLLSTAKEGDTILFQLPPWFPCDTVPNPAGLVDGTLVSWDMDTVTLQVSSSKMARQRITIPSSWVRGFPLRLSLATARDSSGN